MNFSSHKVSTNDFKWLLCRLLVFKSCIQYWHKVNVEVSCHHHHYHHHHRGSKRWEEKGQEIVLIFLSFSKQISSLNSEVKLCWMFNLFNRLEAGLCVSLSFVHMDNDYTPTHLNTYLHQCKLILLDQVSTFEWKHLLVGWGQWLKLYIWEGLLMILWVTGGRVGRRHSE